MSKNLRSLALRATLTCLVISAAACSDTDKASSSEPLAFAASAETVVLADPSDARWPADPLTIDTARITGDTLYLWVSHGGGCADHDYRVVASTAWLESEPVQVPARISHDANGDSCKALLRRQVHVSLTPLAETYRTAYRQDHGSISLRLLGAPGSLIYTF